jgi:hypothetical protein
MKPRLRALFLSIPFAFSFGGLLVGCGDDSDSTMKGSLGSGGGSSGGESNASGGDGSGGENTGGTESGSGGAAGAEGGTAGLGMGGVGGVVDDPCAPGAVEKLTDCADYCRNFLPTCNEFLAEEERYGDDSASCGDSCTDCLTQCNGFTEAQLSCRIENLWLGMCTPEPFVYCPLGGKNGCNE